MKIRIIRCGDQMALYRDGWKIGEGKLNTDRVLEILGIDVQTTNVDENEDGDVFFPERIDMNTGKSLDGEE